MSRRAGVTVSQDEPGGDLLDPSDDDGFELVLPENATPEDVLQLVRELEAVSAHLEALLYAKTRRRRR
jgi:hypothetical protein